MNLFVKRIGVNDIVKHFANAVNGVLCLKPREMSFFCEVLTILFDDIAEGVDVTAEDYPILTAENIKLIAERMDVEESSVNRYILSLKGKDILYIDDNDILKLRQEVIPNVVKGRIQVTILLNIDPKFNSSFANA
jgi:hypothetical protein